MPWKQIKLYLNLSLKSTNFLLSCSELDGWIFNMVCQTSDFHMRITNTVSWYLSSPLMLRLQKRLERCGAHRPEGALSTLLRLPSIFGGAAVTWPSNFRGQASRSLPRVTPWGNSTVRSSPAPPQALAVCKCMHQFPHVGNVVGKSPFLVWYPDSNSNWV